MSIGPPQGQMVLNADLLTIGRQVHTSQRKKELDAGETKSMTREKEKEAEQVDVAIVGAGPAGLYVAWRLIQDDAFKAQRICLFDAADRIGGRVASVSVPGIPFIAELGAMRYLPDQILVKNLLGPLELTSTDFTFDTAFYSLRGQLIRKRVFERVPVAGEETIPYRVDEDERYCGPFQLICLAIRRALSAVDFEAKDVKKVCNVRVGSLDLLRSKLRALRSPVPPLSLKTFTAAEWQVIKRCGMIDTKRLYQMGFWDVLQQYLSVEGYHLAHDGGGYQSIFSMWNAAEAIVWFLADFSTDEYKTIVGGMGKLTDKLFEKFWESAARTGTRVSMADVRKLNWTLEGIDVTRGIRGRRFRLEFVENELLPEPNPVTRRSVLADKVILALPQPALKILRIGGLEGGNANGGSLSLFHSLLDAVTANPLFKLYLVYDRPWWVGVPGGKDESFKVNTDQPLRQIYHFGPNRQEPVPDSGTKEANYRLVMASYSDARYAEYWKKLHDRTSKAYYQATLSDGMGKSERKLLLTILKNYGTSERVVRRAQEQLQRVYNNIETLPEPVLALFKHWSDRPYYAGWHSWNMDTRPWVHAEMLVKPFAGLEIYTCGEAFSSEQGWIEGALKSAERVLERLHLAEPKWLAGNELADYREQKILWR